MKRGRARETATSYHRTRQTAQYHLGKALQVKLHETRATLKLARQLMLVSAGWDDRHKGALKRFFKKYEEVMK